MGWKKLKDHFQIEHHVQIVDSQLLIGSSYVSELAAINMQTGRVKKNETFSRFLEENYPQLLDASTAEILSLIEEPDQFSESITVYTYEGSEITEKLCEATGWPNVTHDGYMMYDNTFSPDKDKVIGWAKRNADAAIDVISEQISDTEKKLIEKKQYLAERRAIRDKLELDHPSTTEI